MNATQREARGQDLVAREHDHARVRRAHVRGAQREQVHPGLRDREHGGPQARRVLADAAVPRSHRHEQGGQEGDAVSGGAGRGWRRRPHRPREAGPHDRRARIPADDAAVAVQDAAGDRPDPRQGRERGARAARVLEEARGEADREGAEVGGGERRARRARRTSRSTWTSCTSSTRSSTKGRSSSASCRRPWAARRRFTSGRATSKSWWPSEDER